MYARPHRRKDQLPLRSLRDLRSRYVFAPVRPCLARWEHRRPQGASMLLLGEGSEATKPYNKDDKIRPHSIRSLQFDQKVRPLSFRPENFDLFTATR